MSYIAPNSVVDLFTDVNLTSNYSDTGFFSTCADKDLYFDELLSKRIGRFNALSYTREERGFVRIECSMARAIGANYMRFRNTSFENKWWYAFVTNVEYINNEVVEIKFELDYITTWMGDFELGECFVERIHPLTDNIGDNIIAENFNFDDYVYSNGGNISPLGAAVEAEMAVCILYAFSGLEDTVHGKRYNGIYSGLGMQAYNVWDLTGINDFLDLFNRYPDAVVAMYMCKRGAITDSAIPDGTGYVVPSSTAGKIVNLTLGNAGIIAGTTQIDGYTPHNNKLYTYPYNFCCISNGQGTTLKLKYEFFDNNVPRVQVCYNIMPPVTESLRPLAYKGLDNTDQNMTLTLDGYPTCSWVSDAFKAWYAQSAVPFAVDVVKGGIMSIGNPTFGATNLLETAANHIKNGYAASLEPDIVKGNITNGNNLFSSGYMHFWWHQMSIPYEIAKMVDHYFDLYGYAYNQVLTPSMRNRPYYTFLKTSGCHVEGSLPSDHAKAIEQIIDNGVRFWVDIGNIGKYSILDNRPI